MSVTVHILDSHEWGPEQVIKKYAEVVKVRESESKEEDFSTRDIRGSGIHSGMY